MASRPGQPRPTPPRSPPRAMSARSLSARSLSARSLNSISSNRSAHTLRSPATKRNQREEWMNKVVVGPLFERAVAQAEAIDAARRRQADFEARLVARPVFTASPFAALGTAGEQHTALGFSSSEGAGLLCSRTELLKLSLGDANLDALELEPLVTAHLQLPTHAPLHSVGSAIYSYDLGDIFI